MYIILTDETKETLKGEYNKRRLVVLFSLLGGLCLVLVLLLLSYYVVLQSEIKSLGGAQGMDQQTETSGTDEMLTIAAVNEKIGLLAAENKSPLGSALLSVPLTAKPDGVVLSSFTKKQVDNTDQLAINGRASTRESLVLFKQRLEASSEVDQVDLPISVLARSKDIDFSLTITFKQH